MSEPKPTQDELTLLTMLKRGTSYQAACRELGDAGIRAMFSCVQRGWVSNGAITPKGREALDRELNPRWEIAVVSPGAGG